MTTDHLDDDENVKEMRETARMIGLTQLLIDARDGVLDVHDAVRRGLKLLGEHRKQVFFEDGKLGRHDDLVSPHGMPAFRERRRRDRRHLR